MAENSASLLPASETCSIPPRMDYRCSTSWALWRSPCTRWSRPLFDVVGDLIIRSRDMQHPIRHQPMGCPIRIGDERIARLEHLPELGNHFWGLGKIDIPALDL